MSVEYMTVQSLQCITVQFSKVHGNAVSTMTRVYYSTVQSTIGKEHLALELQFMQPLETMTGTAEAFS